MAKKIIPAPELPATMGPYSQVVEGVGKRLVFIAGQVPEDKAGNLVGPGDFEAQVRQVFANLDIAVQSAGGKLSDLSKLTILVTRLDAGVYEALGRVRRELFAEAYPASTLMRVAELASPDWLVEIEAYAVI